MQEKIAMFRALVKCRVGPGGRNPPDAGRATEAKTKSYSGFASVWGLLWCN